ncbi:SpoIVB peptidase [Candidatus Galacturonibacter soehngenii]|uniref:SpoIVB peptidase n=1 Tax=Candidatus Galacturonatibacter soehngenii TaxID=2307010 RepID=A0A7V7QJ70_9FIRM|nr:SpoIVB peptidase [Candidatus Galacturonibacter soehngenii]KAB1437649.1 SpoIVB peptidase [Candidatus Galacturonibacter soehngenii]
MKNNRYIDKIFIVVMLLFFICLTGLLFHSIKKALPDEINIIANGEQQFDFGLPVNGFIKSAVEVSEIGESNIPSNQIKIDMHKPFTLKSGNGGSFVMACKLFGLINLKNVKIDVVDKEYVIPCGMPIGIYIQTDGVLVIGTSVVNAMDGMNYEPSYKLVKSGDYIVGVNGTKINNKNELISLINQDGANSIVLNIRRSGELIDVKIEPVQTTPDEYKLGVWVRDNTQGIGTLTFIDKDAEFGALGHGINDVDTSTLMELKSGSLYHTNIVSIIKGEKGVPGELTGTIDYDKKNILGEINRNTTEGIFGISEKILSQYDKDRSMMEVGLKQDVKVGPAHIRCNVEGEIKDYDVEIIEVNTGENNVNKGIVLKVTDERLLNVTGGIVQGMSGSPILQNNKIIGAVTHVFIQDSTKGFGIFIENMLQSKNVE